MFRLADAARPAGWFLMGALSMVAVIPAYHVLPENAAAQALPVRAPERVKEEMFVRIGGTNQWITLAPGHALLAERIIVAEEYESGGEEPLRSWRNQGQL